MRKIPEDPQSEWSVLSFDTWNFPFGYRRT